MAIGTTLKVGFDSSAVKRGFGSIGGMFKGIGRGMAMGAGAMMSKSLVDLAIKAATGVDQLADFSGEAEDTALQVKASTAEIIKLDRALELAGSEVKAGRMLSILRDNIYDAAKGSEDLQKAFRAIGLQSKDFAGKTTMEQFEMIGRAVAAMGDDAGKVENSLEKIFGAKMSMQLLKLFRNQDVFNQAGEEMDGFASNVEAAASRLGKAQDQFKRLPYLWRGLNLAIFNAIGGDGSTVKKLMDGIQQAIDTGDFSKIVYTLKSELAKAIEVMGDSQIWKSIEEKFRGLGKLIGMGIFDSISLKMPGIKLPSLFGGKDDSTSMIDPTTEIMKTNSLLERIYRDGGAMYA